MEVGLANKRLLKLIALLMGLALLAAACGGGDDEGDGAAAPEDVPAEEIPTGGTLTMAGTSDVDYMDPGQSY
jgi:hypothetical protein